MVDSMVDEALDYNVKATGRDGTQKRQELVANCDEVWSIGKHVQKKSNTSKKKRSTRGTSTAECRTSDSGTKRTSRVTSNTRAVYDGKVDERKLQEWMDEMQPKVREVERQLETRERKWMETEDSNSQRRRALEKIREPEAFSFSPYLSSLRQ